VGLVVYDAARAEVGPFIDTEAGDHADMVEVNCRGPVLLCHHFGRRMVQRGRGGLVLLSSLAGFQGNGTIATYAATKAFDLALGEALAHELQPHGVDVLVCAPGATRTPGYERSQPKRSPLPVLEPNQVAREALAALGRRSLVVPGRLNRVARRVMGVMPRRLAVRLMSDATHKLYNG